MREQLLQLIKLSDAGELQKGQHVGNMMLLAKEDGTCHWCCVRDAPSGHHIARNGWSVEHIAIMDVFFGHLAQWCLRRVVDYRDRWVEEESRMVLDPDFVLASFKRGEKTLETVLREARVVQLKAGEWRERRHVTSWRVNVSAWWYRESHLRLGEALDSFADVSERIVRLLDEKSDRVSAAPPPYRP